MPDFENDEIRDSSFPVEFTDEAEALDMYGVWVKSGPRDVSSLDEEETPDSNGEADTVLPVFSDVPDITEFDELPDIEDFDSENEDSAEMKDSAEILLSEDTMSETENNTDIVPEEDDFEFGDISFDEFDTEDEQAESPEVEEITAEEDGSSDDTLSDIALDSSEETPAEKVDKSESDSEQDIYDFDISLEDFDDENPDEVADAEVLEDELEIAVDPDATPVAVDENAEDSAMAEISDEMSESDNQESAESEPSESAEADSDTLADLDPDLANFSMDDFAGIADMVNAAQNESESSDSSLPDEDDLSSLLDEINSGSPPPVAADSSAADDLDLDDFINEINESGGSSEKEKEKLFSDVEPVDIDLEFDEEFIENSEKIRAAGSLISEAEFENSEFGVEFVDETASDDEMQPFESFDTESVSGEEQDTKIQDETVSKLEDTDNLEVATEFDDLLASLDTAAPTASGPSESEEEKVEQEFNLQVTEEDGLESVSDTAPAMDDGDDFSVALFSESNTSDSGNDEPVPDEEETIIEELPVHDEDVQDKSDKEHDSVDISSLEDYVSDNEGITIVDESPTDTEDSADVIEQEPESMDQDISDFEDIPEEIEISNDSDADFDAEVSFSSEESKLPLDDSSVPDSTNQPVEIVEKDNLEITGESDYNEDQPGISDSDEGSISIDFDDVSAFEESLHESGTDTGDIDVTSNDKSTELLMLIAEELSSIKKELSTLNTELSTGVKPGIPSDDSNTDLESAEDGDNTGFFSDDDTDETIALTGDELNNILITADFTEEKTSEPEKDTSEESDASEDVVDLSVDEKAEVSIDDTGEDVTADFNPVEETEQVEDITYDDAPESSEPEELDIPDILSDDEMFGTDTISDNVEVSFVNKVDDDFSYLEGDEEIEPDLEDVAIEESDIETLDFNDENLEEPELTEFNIDFSDIEDSIGSDMEKSADMESEPDNTVEESAVEEVAVEHVPAAESAAEIPVVTDTTASDETDTSEVIDTGVTALPVELKDEIKSVLSYMDQLLESLPEEKIEEFARSEHFDVYKKLFEELGIT